MAGWKLARMRLAVARVFSDTRRTTRPSTVFLTFLQALLRLFHANESNGGKNSFNVKNRFRFDLHLTYFLVFAANNSFSIRELYTISFSLDDEFVDSRFRSRK